MRRKRIPSGIRKAHNRIDFGEAHVIFYLRFGYGFWMMYEHSAIFRLYQQVQLR